MKKTSLILAILALGVGLRAEEAKKSYSVTSDFTYASEYVFRGVKITKAAFQPSVEVTSNGFGLGLWTNQPIASGQNDEIDVYGNYTYKVNDALSIEAVGTYYWYPEAGPARPSLSTGVTNHSFEAGVGATYTINGFSPSLYYYYDFTRETNTLQAAVGYSLPLEAIGSSLDLSVYLGSAGSRDYLPDAPGPKVTQSYNYYGADVSVPYKLSDTAKLTVGGHYANNDNTPAGTAKDRFWLTVGATIGF